MFVSCVHPVAVLNYVFCMSCNKPLLEVIFASMINIYEKNLLKLVTYTPWLSHILGWLLL